jgi:hypothetical protein
MIFVGLQQAGIQVRQADILPLPEPTETVQRGGIGLARAVLALLPQPFNHILHVGEKK